MLTDYGSNRATLRQKHRVSVLQATLAGFTRPFSGDIKHRQKDNRPYRTQVRSGEVPYAGGGGGGVTEETCWAVARDRISRFVRIGFS